MKLERSCGAVLYTLKDGVPYYVVVQEKAGNYSFPKGHIEEGETEIETARREISEETGLTAVFLRGFREEEEYAISGVPGARKRVTYYLAESENGSFSERQGEILQVRLLSYEEALKVFDRPDSRRILTKANDFLTAGTEKET